MILFDTKNLKTERIVLEKDLDFLLQIHNCKETMQWIPTTIKHWNSKQLTKKHTKNKEMYPYNLGMYKISLKRGESTETIGELLLHKYNNNTQSIEIGYIIHKKYWKQGLGTELLQGVEEHLRGKQITLYAQLYEQNIASRYLLEKLNYQLLTTDKISENKSKLTYSKEL